LYEIGTILISPAQLSEALARPQIRVVAFVWVQNLLEYLGFSERLMWLLPPLVVVVILVTLQITSRTRWAVSVKDFLPMTIECVLLAVPLVVLSMVVNRPAAAAALQAPDVASGAELLVNIVTGIGAGIYEELVFRLILICLLMLLFGDLLGMSRGRSVVFSVVISAALFSAHHHIFFVNGGFGVGEVFTPARFMFRTLAGIYFAILFAIRGFGIAAGTHVFYDIIAAVINARLAGAG
ncbi:MAG: hypothetical protein DRP65_12375, partial [Planctomycetota bacterium]